MTQKFGASRRRAFLSALAETGNQTLAAERAKVSRSWVHLHRSSDPEFKRLCDEAVAAAKARLREHAEQAQPGTWDFLGGEELVVRGTGGSGGGKRVQVARARLRQWSPRVEERFLSALTATCNVKAACAEVGLTQASAYGHRQRWPRFAERWKEAVEIGYLQLEMGLIHAAGNLFSDDGMVAVAPIREMTADQAMHLLHMHKHQVHRIGKRPGLRAREADIEDIRADLLRKIEVMKRWRASGLADAEGGAGRRR